MAEPQPCLGLACIPSDCHTVLPGGVERWERAVFLKSSTPQTALISRCQVSQFPCLPCRHQQSCYSPIFWCAEEGLEIEIESRGGASPHTKYSAYPIGTSSPPKKGEPSKQCRQGDIFSALYFVNPRQTSMLSKYLRISSSYSQASHLSALHPVHTKLL